jgi:hypothetical protein
MLNLNGRRMCTISTDASSVVSAETILTFEQINDRVSARYRGGAIVDGYLIGKFDSTGRSLRFCYVQTDVAGNVDAGKSTGTIEQTGEGRLRLTEAFQWFTRAEHGINVFVEIE